MSAQLQFMLTIEENGKTVYSKPLSYENVAYIVSTDEDSTDNTDFFALAAKHLSGEVREVVARKEKLSQETLHLLLNDSSINVLRNLVTQELFKEYAEQDVIETLIKKDTEIAKNIAGDLYSLRQANANDLCKILMDMPDPAIANALANNYQMSKKILKILANHPDRMVSNSAKNQLKNSS